MSKQELLQNIDKLHTTKMGLERISKNLNINCPVVNYCKALVLQSNKIERMGKNWYVYADNAIITINAHSYTIITAHRK